MARSGWLVNRGHEDSAVVRGVPLDDLMVRSILDNDWQGLATHLQSYRKFLEASAVPAPERSDRVSNPFGARGEEQMLPGSLLDCVPQNLIVSRTGELELVDHEWEADGDCSLNLVFLRGLMVLAARVVDGGSAPALVDRLAVSTIDVTRELARTAGLFVDNSMVERLIVAEYELQSLVAVAPFGTLESYRAGLLNPARPATQAVPRLRLLRASEERDRALSLVSELRADRALVDEDRQRILADRDRVVGELGVVLADRDRVVGELGVVLADRDRVVGELGVVLADRQRVNEDRERLADAVSHLRREVETVRSSSAYRIGRAITWPLRAPRAFVQRIAK